jgi:hypothetical protein
VVIKNLVAWGRITIRLLLRRTLVLKEHYAAGKNYLGIFKKGRGVQLSKNSKVFSRLIIIEHGIKGFLLKVVLLSFQFRLIRLQDELP